MDAVSNRLGWFEVLSVIDLRLQNSEQYHVSFIQNNIVNVSWFLYLLFARDIVVRRFFLLLNRLVGSLYRIRNV